MPWDSDYKYKTLQSKCKNIEKELIEQRHYTKDLEKSLKINKDLVQNLISETVKDSELQKQLNVLLDEN